ncbi:type II secretion system secretin GspD [Limnobacter humi]|uniref:Type II secretion system secretin GspD n=2 Tax=Limnobacter humi TaxID=1778671 RepID=A0ABT1WJE1_9BURK|nr:type II secretion system secretin GspD [Limnobacter humi]MCQ8897632.1 type II secretion system secretin GspD [Limnobacter humi]
MNTARNIPVTKSVLNLMLATLLAGVGNQAITPALAAPNSTKVQGQASDRFSLNFVNAEIDAVVRAIGSFTNQTFVVDPRVRGTISLVSPEPLSAADAKNALLAALRLQGFTIVESGGVARVVPENDAKIQASNEVDPRRAMNQSGGAIVTQVFQLNYESATALVPVLRPLIAPNNTIAAYPNNNTLVITDYADNLQRIARIIASIDGPSSGDLEVVPLEHALAVDIATILNRMLDEGNRGTGAAVDAGQRLTVMADPRTNSLLIRTPSQARLNLAKNLIRKLDQPTKQPGNVWVVYLKNAEATKLAKTLQGVLTNSPIKVDTGSGLSQNNVGAGGLGTGNLNGPSGLGSSPTGSTGSASGLSGGVGGATGGQLSVASGNNDVNNGGIVQADASTNSLIITAPEPVYRNLRSIIEKLDVRRAQVFVESLIVEVSSDKAAEFGIQFQGLSGAAGNSAKVIGGTNFNDIGSGKNIIGASANLGSIGRGLNIGIIDGQVNIPGVGTISNLGFLARALESKANANILSTPNILTLDNEEAKIVIGQNVPFITGQFANAGGNGGAAINPFQTIERQDVGLTLRVKPQVSEGGVVKLGIFQEVSSVVDSTNVSGIITNKRSIESNVLVESGNIIVLGGLVEDRVTGNEEKVPGIGDVPVLGQFFRYDNRRRMKTNLMVFLRPVVVRNEDQAQSIVTNRYDYMRAQQQGNQLENRFALPDMKGPVLPDRSLREIKPNNTGSPSASSNTGPNGAQSGNLQLAPAQRILVIPRPAGSAGGSNGGSAN